MHDYASGLTSTPKAALFCSCKRRKCIGQNFKFFGPEIGCPCRVRKSWAACAQSFAPRQQATEITLLLLVRATYIYFCSSRTSRSWWITQSTQNHRRGCNTLVTRVAEPQVFGWSRIFCPTPQIQLDFLHHTSKLGIPLEMLQLLRKLLLK